MLFHHSKKPVELQVIHLNKTQEKRKKLFEELDKANAKSNGVFAKLCCLKKDKKDKDKETKSNSERVFVLDFEGDIKAGATNHLREEISTIISVANTGDEVVIRLESGGGQVNAYGLAAAQIVRLKHAGLKVTICVDKIAASGGYMMACVADKILASDFAIIGSVGVVSQLPNFHEFLKKHDIAIEMFTAGEYKRTVTMFGENSEEDRVKYQEELNRIHELFKEFIKTHRPALEIERIATGEFWLATDALSLGLIDGIQTSDAYLLSLMQEHDVFVLHSRSKPTLAEKLGLSEQMAATALGVCESVGQSALTALSKFTRP